MDFLWIASGYRPRNDERGRGFYFLRKQNEAKTFSGCATRLIFLWGGGFV